MLLDQGRVYAVGTAEEVLVPENLGPVYQVDVLRFAVDGGFQLVFAPRQRVSRRPRSVVEPSQRAAGPGL